MVGKPFLVQSGNREWVTIEDQPCSFMDASTLYYLQEEGPYRDGIKVKLYHMIEGFNSVRMDGQLMRLAFADFRKFSFQQLKNVQLGDNTSAYSSLGAMEAI